MKIINGKIISKWRNENDSKIEQMKGKRDDCLRARQGLLNIIKNSEVVGIIFKDMATSLVL